MNRFRLLLVLSALLLAADIIVRLGPRGKLVGVSTFAQTPEVLAGIQRIGGFSNPTLQKIISLEPDIIIATSDVHVDTGTVLPVLPLNPHRLYDIEKKYILSVRHLGCRWWLTGWLLVLQLNWLV